MVALGAGAGVAVIASQNSDYKKLHPSNVYKFSSLMVGVVRLSVCVLASDIYSWSLIRSARTPP